MRYLPTTIAIVSAAVLAGFTADSARAQDAGTLTVQNNRDVPVTVYVEGTMGDAGPLREVRIGMVPPKDTRQIQIPEWAASENTVQAFLHVEGSGDLATEGFPVGPGVDIGTIVTTSDMGDIQEMTRQMPQEGATTVRVQNNRMVPVTVLVRESRPALGPTLDSRVGVVPAESTVEMALPEWVETIGEEVVFVLQPAGDADLTSQTVNLIDGSTPELLVPTS